MRLYNTKTRQIEEFKPLSSREVKVYSCGPTVYNYAHIWNLRAYVFEDMVVRTLRFLGYNVIYTMNLTDIDDKTIRDSQKAWVSLKEFTEKYSKIFLEDIAKLNILRPDNVVPISTLIPEMVRMINTMLKRWNAYLWDDNSIYFDVKTFKKYWEFANLDMWNLKAGARVNNDEYDKESASDFALWKAWKPEDWDNFWEEEFTLTPDPSPERIGEERRVVLKWRPGWHIECSACNMKYFGQQIDIHMWGIDLIFPHHQNEIAQSESCTHKEFSKYWIHSGHLMVDWKKMAKSAGNFYRLIDLEEKYLSTGKQKAESWKGITSSLLYRAIRLGYINAKYASELDFTFDKIDSNIVVIRGIDEAVGMIVRKLGQEVLDDKDNTNVLVRKEFSDKMQEFISEYIEKLEDNFNTPEALVVFHEFLKFVNTGLRKEEFSNAELESLLDMFKTFNQVLAIIDFEALNKDDEVPEEILKKLEDRNTAKKNKNFEEADRIRDELLALGWKIVDERGGSRVERV